MTKGRILPRYPPTNIVRLHAPPTTQAQSLDDVYVLVYTMIVDRRGIEFQI